MEAGTRPAAPAPPPARAHAGRRTASARPAAGGGALAAAWPRARTLAADLFALTKPKVQTLLLFTTVATM